MTHFDRRGTLFVVLITALFVAACSTQPQVTDTDGGDDFLGDLHAIMTKHVAPNPAYTAALVSKKLEDVEPILLSLSETQGEVGNVFYLTFGEKAIRARLPYGLSFLTEEDMAASKTLVAAECRIDFDLPRNRENIDAWGDYLECFLGLIDSCGQVFTHIDENGDWVSNCIDPKG